MNTYIMFNVDNWSVMDPAMLKSLLIYLYPLKKLFSKKQVFFSSTTNDFSTLVSSLNQYYYFGFITPGFLSNHSVVRFNRVALENVDQVLAYYPLKNSRFKPIKPYITYDMNEIFHTSLRADYRSLNNLVFSSSSIANSADFVIPHAYNPYFFELIKNHHITRTPNWPDSKNTFHTRILLKSFFNSKFKIKKNKRLARVRLKDPSFQKHIYRTFFRKYYRTLSHIVLRRTSLKLLSAILFKRKKKLKAYTGFNAFFANSLIYTSRFLKKIKYWDLGVRSFYVDKYYPKKIFNKKNVQTRDTLKQLNSALFQKKTLKPSWGSSTRRFIHTGYSKPKKPSKPELPKNKQLKSKQPEVKHKQPEMRPKQTGSKQVKEFKRLISELGKPKPKPSKPSKLSKPSKQSSIKSKRKKEKIRQLLQVKKWLAEKKRAARKLKRRSKRSSAYRSKSKRRRSRYKSKSRKRNKNKEYLRQKKIIRRTWKLVFENNVQDKGSKSPVQITGVLGFKTKEAFWRRFNKASFKKKIKLKGVKKLKQKRTNISKVKWIKNFNKVIYQAKNNPIKATTIRTKLVHNGTFTRSITRRQKNNYRRNKKMRAVFTFIQGLFKKVKTKRKSTFFIKKHFKVRKHKAKEPIKLQLTNEEGLYFRKKFFFKVSAPTSKLSENQNENLRQVVKTTSSDGNTSEKKAFMIEKAQILSFSKIVKTLSTFYTPPISLVLESGKSENA